MTTTPSEPDQNSVNISSSPRLALLIIVFSLCLLPLPFNPWPTVVVGLFGVFLLVQTYSLRLEFTNDTLVVWRGQQSCAASLTPNGRAGDCLPPGCQDCFISAKSRASTSCRSSSTLLSCGTVGTRVGSLETPKP